MFLNNSQVDSYVEKTGELWTYTIPVSLVYVLVIGLLRTQMKSVAPFNLKGGLALWSFLLAAFSLVGTATLLPQFVKMILERGFRYSVCSKESVEDSTVKLWVYLFAWSKLFELGDTLFIVLRKQPLIFLHWYHHALTLIYCFTACANLIGAHQWMMTLNLTIHSIMYSYYTLRACNITLPKIISMGITCSQILQMIVGLIVSSYSCFSCDNVSQADVYSSLFAVVIYSSYCVLFINFFIQSYLVKGRKNK